LVAVSSRSQLESKQADPKTKVQPGRCAPRLIGTLARHTLLYCLQHLILNSFLRVCSCQRS
jgi:hypothetical protein